MASAGWASSTLATAEICRQTQTHQAVATSKISASSRRRKRPREVPRRCRLDGGAIIVSGEPSRTENGCGLTSMEEILPEVQLCVELVYRAARTFQGKCCGPLGGRQTSSAG